MVLVLCWAHFTWPVCVDCLIRSGTCYQRSAHIHASLNLPRHVPLRQEVRAGANWTDGLVGCAKGHQNPEGTHGAQDPKWACNSWAQYTEPIKKWYFFISYLNLEAFAGPIRKVPFLILCIYPKPSGSYRKRPFKSGTRPSKFSIRELCPCLIFVREKPMEDFSI